MGLIIGPLSNVPPIISTPVAAMGKTSGVGDSRNRNDENLTYYIDDNPYERVCYHSQRTSGLWLSLVERCVRDAEAAGSNPVNPTRDQRREPTGSLLVLAGGVDSLREQDNRSGSAFVSLGGVAHLLVDHFSAYLSSAVSLLLPGTLRPFILG